MILSAIASMNCCSSVNDLAFGQLALAFGSTTIRVLISLSPLQFVMPSARPRDASCTSVVCSEDRVVNPDWSKRIARDIGAELIDVPAVIRRSFHGGRRWQTCCYVLVTRASALTQPTTHDARATPNGLSERHHAG